MGEVYKKISYDKVFHEICFDHLDDLVEEIDFSYWMCTRLETNKQHVMIFEFENKEQSKIVLQSIEKLLYKVFIEVVCKVRGPATFSKLPKIFQCHRGIP